MGLFTGLLTLPLAPVRGVAWLADQLEAEAEREYEQRTALQARLAEIEQAREAGEISLAESVALEEQVLDGFPDE